MAFLYVTIKVTDNFTGSMGHRTSY